MTDSMTNALRSSTPLGITVNNLSLSETVDKVCDLIARCDGIPRLVSTLNVDFLVNTFGLRRDRSTNRELLQTLRSAEIVTADGFPILWLSNLVGDPLQERVCGSDLVPALAARAAETGLSLYLLGGANGVADAAATTLQTQYAGLSIAGTAAPMIATEGPDAIQSMIDDEALVAEINKSGADILLIGMGNPKQEIWFNRNRHRLTVPVSIGVGGTFEFITGGVKRAPQWMQRTNLEWIFRITQDPKRLWHRYAKGLVFLSLYGARLAASRCYEQLFAISANAKHLQDVMLASIQSANRDNIVVAKMPRHITPASADAIQDALREIESVDTLVMDFTETRNIALSAQSRMASLIKAATAAEINVVDAGLRNQLRNKLTRTFADDLLYHAHASAIDYLVNLSGKASPGTPQYCAKGNAIWLLEASSSAETIKAMTHSLSRRAIGNNHSLNIDFRKINALDAGMLPELTRLIDSVKAKGLAITISGVPDQLRKQLQSGGFFSVVREMDDHALMQLILDQGQIDA